MNKDEIEGVAKATAEIVKAVPVYDDAIQPVAKEVGKALKTVGGVINVALAPLSAMVYGYEVIGDVLKKKLEARLAGVSPENIVSPRLQVVGPLMEQYKYVHDNEELSAMFVNLLANAMDKDNIKKAHPSFVKVITELSPDEAKLVKCIYSESLLPKIDVTLKVKFKAKNDEEKSGYLTIEKNFTLLGEKAELDYPELTASYLSNLERLMIIQCTSGSMQDGYVDKDIYKPLEEHPEISKIKAEDHINDVEEAKIDIVRGRVEVTDFGKMFMEAVL